MKIAILVFSFPPKRLAGTEIATYNIAKCLVKRRHKVHVITSWDKGLLKESVENGFYVHRIKLDKVKFLGIILFWIKTLIVLRKINPKVIHGQSIPSSVPGFLVKKILGKPYVVYSRGSDVYLPWRFKRIRSNLVLKSADAVIALTEDMKKEMQNICNREIFVIPNGIILTNFQNLSKEETRDNLQIKNGERIVLFVGRLHPVKGVKYLIQAMDVIRRRNAGARLMLVGDGEEGESLEGLVKELNLEKQITFVGKVPNESIPQYMAASDVLVLPSLSEGFSIVLLEAMASGLSIVATKVGGVPEVIKDGENGFLVESESSKKIAEKVLLLLNNDRLKRQISRNNKEKAKKYSWKKIVEKLEKIYFRVLE